MPKQPSRVAKISFAIGEDLVAALEARSQADGVTRSEIARRAISAYLGKPELGVARPRGNPKRKRDDHR